MTAAVLFWYNVFGLFALCFVIVVFALLGAACRMGGIDAWLDWGLPLRWCDPCSPEVRDFRPMLRSRAILAGPLGRYEEASDPGHR